MLEAAYTRCRASCHLTEMAAKVIAPRLRGTVVTKALHVKKMMHIKREIGFVCSVDSSGAE